MKKPGREFSRAYGVTVDEGDLRIAVAERSRGGATTRSLVAVSLGAAGLDDPARLSPIQADLLAGTATLAAALPAGQGFTRWLETPFGSRRKAERVLPALLDIQLPFPLEACAHRFPTVRKSPDGSRVRALAVAARHQDLARHLDRLRALGLDPPLVEHEALALWSQQLREQTDKVSGVRVIAYLGTGRAALVLGKDEDLVAAFALGQGVHALEEEANRPAFLRRIRHILQAHVPQGAAGVRWTWAGPGAERTPLVRAVEAALGEEVDATFDTAPDPGSFLARGLAADALDGTAARGNLRTGALEHPASTGQRQGQLRRTAVSGVLAGTLLCAIGLAGPAMLAHKERQLQGQISQQAKDLTGMRIVPRGQELVIVEQRLDERRRREAMILRAGKPTASRVVAQAVAQAGPAGVTLTRITANTDFFSIVGAAEDRGRAEQFAERLGDKYRAPRLEIEETGGDGVRFVVKGEAVHE
jgi:hypothetical protein